MVLRFDRAGLNGTIPAEIGDLTFLKEIRILSNFNFLSGTLPTEIGLLTNLEVAYFQENNEVIPTQIGLLTNLKTLRLKGEGTIPTCTEIGYLTELQKLLLIGAIGDGLNGLTGTVPAELGSLTALTRITFAGTYDSLSGGLPAEVCDLLNFNLAGISFRSGVSIDSDFVKGPFSVRSEDRSKCDMVSFD